MFAEENPVRIRNEDTGMDICVDDHKEVSGPLGGTTVEYRIRVDTTRLEYTTNVHQSDQSIVSFATHKTFKEIEYFLKKLKSKYPDVKELPHLDCDKSPLKEDREMRKSVANDVMSFIAKDKVLSSSTLLFSFLGYDPRKNVENSKLKEPTKSSEEIATKLSTGDKTEPSDDMFLEAKDGEPTEEEDLFQEFKRQSANVGGGDGGLSSTLFADSPSKTRQSKSRKDDLFLFSRQNMGGALRGDELDANGLFVPSYHNTTTPSKSKDEVDSKLKGEEMEELLTIDDSLSDIWKEMQPKKVVVGLVTSKPEVKTKPAVARKPTLPPKVCSGASKAVPVPAPRSKPVPTRRRTSSDTESPAEKEMAEIRDNTSATRVQQPEAADLSALDILTYIEQQQQPQNSNLFS